MKGEKKMLKSRIEEIREILIYSSDAEIKKVLAELGVETEAEAESKLEDLSKDKTFMVELHSIECNAEGHSKEDTAYILSCAIDQDTFDTTLAEFETMEEARAFVEKERAKLPPVREYSYTVKTLHMKWLKLKTLDEDWENGAVCEDDFLPLIDTPEENA